MSASIIINTKMAILWRERIIETKTKKGCIKTKQI